MGSVHKTFQQGEILASQDVNDALNPATADHIPWAMDAGQATITNGTQSTKVVSTKITFANGRFTRAPIVTASMASATGGLNKLVARVWDISTNGAVVGLYNGDGQDAPTNFTAPVNWIAVQMGK